MDYKKKYHFNVPVLINYFKSFLIIQFYNCTISDSIASRSRSNSSSNSYRLNFHPTFQLVILESDCKQVVDWMKATCFNINDREFGVILGGCSKKLQNIQNYPIQFVGRKANQVAYEWYNINMFSVWKKKPQI